MTLEEEIEEYIKSLNEMELKAYEIAKSNFHNENIFKEIVADLKSFEGNKELAGQIYRELILRTQESGQSPEAFIIKYNNLHRLNTSK